LILLTSLVLFSILSFYIARNKSINFLEDGFVECLHKEYGYYLAIQFCIAFISSYLLFLLLNFFIFNLIINDLILNLLLLTTSSIYTFYMYRKIIPSLNARDFIENVIQKVLFLSSLITIATTVGILFSIIFEAISFFNLESFWYFTFGTQWSPDASMPEGNELEGNESGGIFGSVPLFAGTFMITFIAMAISLPIGLLSAIYMSQYASSKARSRLKPILETLAGIPTVVYGFFAAITVAPFIVDVFSGIGFEVSFNNALACGVVMGIMIIPIVSSLSEDIINATPKNLKEGSLALGMTHSESIIHIVLPSAYPGIISAFLLALSRAIGETMIVVMAAGLRANLTANPLEDMTTVTVRIVDALVGDQEFHSAETLSAFALALFLFVITLLINLISLHFIRKFKKKYKTSNL